MTRRMELVVTVALEAKDGRRRFGRAEASRREDVTDKVAIMRREPLARDVMLQLAGVTASDILAEVLLRVTPGQSPGQSRSGGASSSGGAS